MASSGGWKRPGGPQLGQRRRAGLPDRSRDWRAWSGRSSSTSSATPACMATAANPCPATSWTSRDPHPLLQRRPGHKVVSCPLGRGGPHLDQRAERPGHDQPAGPPQQQDRRQVVRVSHHSPPGRPPPPPPAHMPAATVHAMAPGDLEHRHHHAQLDGAVGVAGQQIDAHRPDRAAERRHGRGAPPRQRARGGHHEHQRPGGRWKVAARTEPAMTTAAAPAASQTSIGGGTPGASLHRRGACILRAG